MCLRLLVLLADDDADAVVRACQVAAQGQHWQPNMFIYTLQKRHSHSDPICTLAAELLTSFSDRMPVTSPIQLSSPRPACSPREAEQRESFKLASPAHRRTHTLPAIGSPKQLQPMLRLPHSPTTTMSCLYMEAPSPYAPRTRLPLTRPPTSPLEQSRRSRIFSTPKLAAVDGDHFRRCQTPNAPSPGRARQQFQLFEGLRGDDIVDNALGDPFAASPPTSPVSESAKKKRTVVLSEKYSWNPECINSVSGFEWWWRSLPQDHASLEPTQKLKVVTKAAVRLHTKGDWQRAIELYLLALAMEINDEVQFRLRVNLACAYEAAQELAASAEAFRAALALNGSDAYAQFKLGEVLGAAGDFAAARELFEAVQDAYPLAADALTRLQETEELRLREEEERRVATAKAKVRRSPPKQTRLHRQSTTDKSGRVANSSDSSPVASASVNGNNDSGDSYQSDALAPTAANKHADDDNGVAERSSIGGLTEVATAPVPTPTTDDNSESLFQAEPRSSESELDRFVERCVLLDADLRRYLVQIDVHSRGLVRLSSVLAIWRVLCGDDVPTSALDRLLAPDCVVEDGQTLVRYANILTALEAKRRSAQEGRRALAVEETLTKTRLQALVQQEARGCVRGLAEACAEEWVSAGAQRAIASCAHVRIAAVDAMLANGSSAGTERDAALTLTDRGPQATDVHERTRAVADSTSDNERDTAESGQLTGRSDGDPSLSPRLDAKRERAKREQVLRREQSRVFARKHVHCLRSLRSLALRARAHYAARVEAVESLQQLARDARRTSTCEVPSRDGQNGDSESEQSESEQPPNVKSRDEVLAYATAESVARVVSRAVWAASAESAMRRVVLASELLALQYLARDVAASSRVGQLLLPVYEGWHASWRRPVQPRSSELLYEVARKE